VQQEATISALAHFNGSNQYLTLMVVIIATGLSLSRAGLYLHWETAVNADSARDTQGAEITRKLRTEPSLVIMPFKTTVPVMRETLAAKG
jgi:hypothetical protein